MRYLQTVLVAVTWTLCTAALASAAAPKVVWSEEAEKFATPGVVTIEALSKEPYKVAANRQIKTLVYIADSKPVIILIRGDDQLNETKFMAKSGAKDARPATPEEIVALLGAKPGSLGAVVNVPAEVEVGVPLIVSPVRVRPAGSVPLVTANVYGAVPPDAAMVCE